ncbi:thiamine ABC transporter substrate-binding protein [Actinomyces slackii]|uniref:thiamine ABC transporter substrate-binding protein n=1 Tax=Actinomyces slackii TaxID=52774 RepID=UPI0039E7BC97
MPPAPHARPARSARPALGRRGLLGAAGAVIALLGLGLAACSGSGGSGAGSKKVTVVTHDSFSLSEDVLASFSSETGYELVHTTSGDAGALVNKLVLTKDAPLGDAVFGIDNTYASRALEQGIIDTTTAVTLPASAKPYIVEDTPALAPIDMGDVCLNIDTAYFSSKGLTPPATFEDVAKPEYAGLLVAIDPSTSSTGMAWLLATVGHFGAEGFADYWKSLVAGGARIDAGWEEAYYTNFSGAGEGGTYPIVVSYASSPAYTLSDDGASSTTSALLDTAFRQVEFAGVLAGAANPKGGRAFVEWMLTRTVQEDIPGQMYMYPVDDGAALPTEITSFGPLAKAPVEVTPADITANRETWLEQWTKAVGA